MSLNVPRVSTCRTYGSQPGDVQSESASVTEAVTTGAHFGLRSFAPSHDDPTCEVNPFRTMDEGASLARSKIARMGQSPEPPDWAMATFAFEIKQTPGAWGRAAAAIKEKICQTES